MSCAAASVSVVIISDLEPRHADEAIALWHDCGLTRPWNDPLGDVQRALAGPTSTVLAATEDGQLLGTVMVGHDGHRGWVYYLAVQPGLQRAGVGRQLMEASESWLRARAVPKLNLMVRAGNSSVIAFYEKLGYGDGDVLVLGKFLDG